MPRNRSVTISIVVVGALCAATVLVSVAGAFAHSSPSRAITSTAASQPLVPLLTASPATSPSPATTAAVPLTATDPIPAVQSPSPPGSGQAAPSTPRRAPSVPAAPAVPAPVPPPAVQPVPVPMPPQPVFGSYQMTASCAGETLYVSAAAHATGHPSITDARIDFFYPGSINGRGFDMGSGNDTHVMDSAVGMPTGSYTVDLLLFVFDSNGQEASRSASFPVTCSGP